MNLMLKEWIIQIDIKTPRKGNVCLYPFDCICHIIHLSLFNWLSIVLSQIYMDDLQRWEVVDN